MTQAEFTSLLKEQIGKTNHAELVDFSVNICEQLFPDYESFSKAEDWGNVKLMKDTINFCKLSRDEAPENIASIIDLNELEENIPDIDESETLDSSTAMNASCAIFELLEFINDRDLDHIVNIATYMTDTVQFKLADSDPTLTAEELDSHTATVDERTRLIALI